MFVLSAQTDSFNTAGKLYALLIAIPK
jgi:hypothetical protein